MLKEHWQICLFVLFCFFEATKYLYSSNNEQCVGHLLRINDYLGEVITQRVAQGH